MNIKKVFLQIQFSELDRPFLRFLWWQNGVPDKLRIFHHRRVVFFFPCSHLFIKSHPSIPSKTITRKIWRNNSKLLESFYVDSRFTSVDIEEDLKKFVHGSKFLFETAKFGLWGWEHNILNQISKIQFLLRDVFLLFGVEIGFKWRFTFYRLERKWSEKWNFDKKKKLSLTHKVFLPLDILQLL